MKLLRNYGFTITVALTIVMSSCGGGPIEHGTEYVLVAPADADTASMRATQTILGERLNSSGLDGDFEISATANQITVRIRQGAVQDSVRIRTILQSSADLKFRAMYSLGEVAFTIDTIHKMWIRINPKDSTNPDTPGLWEFLVPADYGDYESPLIAYCRPSDTATVNAIFRHDSIKPLLPPDLVFHWGKGVYHQNAGPTVALFACKEGRNYVMSGNNIVSVAAQENNDMPEIAITFDEIGARDFTFITQRNVGRSLAIELDNFVYNWPKVNQEIKGGLAVITGDFTEAETEDLVRLLSAGTLPVQLQLQSETAF